MRTDALLTWYQALQLPGLTMSLLTLLFLCFTARKFSLFLVPALYFATLTGSFILPLANLFEINTTVRGALILGETMVFAMSFLLIVQLITGRAPPLFYWAILAVPLIGGSSLVYATLITQDEVCMYEHFCTEPVVLKQLYDIFSTSLIFLLIVFVHRRLVVTAEGEPQMQPHKFMLVMALVMLNLAILGITLGEINGAFSIVRANFAITLVRIGFMYMVTTSIFRVFDSPYKIAPAAIGDPRHHFLT